MPSPTYYSYDYYIKFYCVSNNDGYTSHSDMCVTAGKYFPLKFHFFLDSSLG